MSVEGTAPVEDEITLTRDSAGHATAVEEAPEAPVVKKEILDAYKVLRNEVERSGSMHSVECELEAIKTKIKTGEEQIRLMRKKESALEDVLKEMKEDREKLDAVAAIFGITENK